jgi:hypothetical protein
MSDDTQKSVVPPLHSEDSSGAPSESSSPASSASEQPEIYGISKGKNGPILNRRSFLGLAATLGATGALAGCGPLSGLAGGGAAPPDQSGAGKAHGKSVDGLELRDTALYSWDAETLKIWDVSTGTIKNYVPKASFSESMKHVGFMFPDLFLHIYDSGKVAFSPDGSVLAVNARDGVALWRSVNGKPEKITTLKGGPGAVSTLALHPYGGLAAAGGTSSASGNVLFTVWNVKGGPARHVGDIKSALHSLAFHPSRPLLLSAHADGAVREWNLSDGKLRNEKFCHAKAVRQLAVAPDGKMAVTSADGAITLWTLPDWKEAAQLNVPQGETVSAMNLGDDGRILATGTSSGCIYLWRMPAGKLIGGLFDPDLLDRGTPISKYRQMGAKTLTQPCDRPLPANTACLCDCVAASRTCDTTQQICTCDTIAVPAGYAGRGLCVCDTVLAGSRTVPQCSCVGHVSSPGCSCVGNVSHGSHYWRPN